MSNYYDLRFLYDGYNASPACRQYLSVKSQAPRFNQLTRVRTEMLHVRRIAVLLQRRAIAKLLSEGKAEWVLDFLVQLIPKAAGLVSSGLDQSAQQCGQLMLLPGQRCEMSHDYNCGVRVCHDILLWPVHRARDQANAGRPRGSIEKTQDFVGKGGSPDATHHAIRGSRERFRGFP